MNKAPNSKYDLEDRTKRFSQKCRDYINKLPRTLTNIEYGTQLARSSGSPGANYIEANESLSRKDFVLRIKICRKESKESAYWLQLSEPKHENQNERADLIDEAQQLVKIFNAIIEKSS